jgi:LacI family transcriptional regulator
MPKSKVSIKDIADRLKISKTTVSFILNGKAKEKRISSDLVSKVEAIIEEVGYRPNQLAQSLRTGKTNIIGLMVEDISNPFFSTIAKHIEEKAHKNGYKIIYCSTENDNDRARDFLNMFRNLGVDGYIITPTPHIADEVRTLIETGANVVLFDRNFEDVKTDCVMVDNEYGIYTGTQHLIRQGYQNIGFFTLDSQQAQMHLRMKGYQKAMQEADLEEIVFKVPFCLNRNDYVKRIADMLQSTSSKLDALLFSTNYLGVSGLEALVRIEANIKDDLGVVCFDDNDLFKIFTPTISVISQPMEAMSEEIIETLLMRLHSKGKKIRTPRQIILPTKLIVRDSSRVIN